MSLWQESKKREIMYEEIPPEGWAYVKRIENKFKDVITGDLKQIALSHSPCKDVYPLTCENCMFYTKPCFTIENILKYKWLKTIQEKYNEK